MTRLGTRSMTRSRLLWKWFTYQNSPVNTGNVRRLRVDNLRSQKGGRCMPYSENQTVISSLEFVVRPGNGVREPIEGSGGDFLVKSTYIFCLRSIFWPSEVYDLETHQYIYKCNSTSPNVCPSVCLSVINSKLSSSGFLQGKAARFRIWS